MSYEQLLNDFKIIPLNSKIHKKKKSKINRKRKPIERQDIQGPIHAEEISRPNEESKSTKSNPPVKLEQNTLDTNPKSINARKYEKEVKKYYKKKFTSQYKQFIINLLNKNQ